VGDATKDTIGNDTWKGTKSGIVPDKRLAERVKKKRSKTRGDLRAATAMLRKLNIERLLIP